ncbi:YtzH-like family protein [Pseudalkalibacillus berkeleyi]|uniref:YtzH-like family protein n=1 Tax=Pseudalkalibacillus berkeleyi TaxID=1069813 RepID=A0ABS9H001_9BACL|nr:YtzH-like family protein [Pseudalkalibacillus berkeleyi]MCF6138328.1 YtzH-like family protein [Pseudalkalibacillus berkeleyi]
MPLQVTDQLSLLMDILRSHQLDQCGSNSECAQIQRLTNSLLQNPQTPLELRETLTSIQTYSQGGNSAPSVDQHVMGYQNELNQWMNVLEHN